MPDSQATAPFSNVTLAIQHVVKPEAVERYEAWLKEITVKAAGYPGHQGVHVIRPAPGSTTYAIAIRFATAEAAMNWTTSADRRAFVERIADALEGAEHLDIQPGIEFWFTPPGGQRKARPWKQWLITTSVIWPLSMLIPLAYRPLFGLVPALGQFGVSHLLVASTIVALVTWAVMPRYVKLVSAWLFR